jgi:acyl carrier protein
VLFSSVAAVFGNFGQANYAIANGFMNGLVQLRTAQGLPGVALCFGPWQSAAAQGGMAQAQSSKINAQGYQWLTPELLQPHWAKLANASGQLVLAQADWPVLAGALQQPALLQPLLQSQSNLPASASENSVAQGTVDISYWRQLPRPQAELAVQDWLCAQIEAITGLHVDFDQSLMAQGVDSLAAVTIRSTLSQQLALRLPVSLLFNFPTIPLLAGELCQQLFGAVPATATIAEMPATQSFNYLEDLSEAELNALILQEFSAV